MRNHALKLVHEARSLTEAVCPHCGGMMLLVEAESSPVPPRITCTFACARCDEVTVVKDAHAG